MVKAHISRWSSAALYAAILLAFLLPFATVSCEDEKVRFTGAELALFQVPEKPPVQEDSLADGIESESSFSALIALAAAGAGLALGVARRGGGGTAAVAGLVAMLHLAWEYATGSEHVDVHVGFVLALVGYLAAATTHAFATWRRRRAARAAAGGARTWWRRFAGGAAATVVALAALAAAGCGGASADDEAYVEFDTADGNAAWAPDGGAIGFERGGSVHLVAPDGSCPRRLAAGAEPAWSPTGDELAVTRCSGETCAVMVVDMRTGAERELVRGPFSAPSWSGDGTRVYLTRHDDDATATWVVRADGTRLRRLAAPWVEPSDRHWSPAAVAEDDPTFSPDGARYAFAASDAPTVGIDALQEAIFARSVRGGGRRQLSDPPGNDGDYEPAWSPDGRRIAFQRSGQIAVMNADGSDERIVTIANGATDPAWSPDSRQIVYTDELYGGGHYFAEPSALMIVDIESGDTRRLTWGPKPVAPCTAGG